MADHPGIGLDVEGAVAAVTAAAYSSDRRIAEVSVGEIPATVTAEQLNALGITRKISTFTTDMGVSSSNRIHNVQLMADYIDGTIIEPGETFSFNAASARARRERGFREGQMIVGSLLLPAIGGGVCQTATTLFNNAFELGLPIVDRYNHSFYISHYPMGRDATVSWGGPDFVFKNDLKTRDPDQDELHDSTLTFTFYGTDRQRRVVPRRGPRTNWRSPRTTYALDPYAARGSVRTVPARTSAASTSPSRGRCTSTGSCCARTRSTSSYIAVGPTVDLRPGDRSPGRTSCCRASSSYCASALAGSGVRWVRWAQRFS